MIRAETIYTVRKDREEKRSYIRAVEKQHEIGQWIIRDVYAKSHQNPHMCYANMSGVVMPLPFSTVTEQS